MVTAVQASGLAVQDGVPWQSHRVSEMFAGEMGELTGCREAS